jgi:ATP-dependent RNA helicase SUPV3L1/SUV3
VDKEIDAALYRAAGYRVCGERAVRVDILERLADLIRPALAWREGAPGQKPPGAVVGGGFMVVNTMTSLTGASGEDFASILRSLGYRLERRPKPPELVEPVPIDAVAAVEIASSGDETAPAAETPEEIAADADVTDAATETSLTPPDAEHATGETQPALDPATEPAPSEPALEAPAAPVAAEDAAQSAESAPPPPETSAAPPAEPEMIDVWRPGRAEGRPRRHRRHRERGKHFGRRPGAENATAAPTPEGAAAAAPAGDGAPAEQGAEEASRAEAGQPERHSRHRRREGEQRFGGEQRFDRPRRDRDRPPSNASRHERQDRRPERREKAPDPNSPFAKLAVLKAQLEADAKERR